MISLKKPGHGIIALFFLLRFLRFFLTMLLTAGKFAFYTPYYFSLANEGQFQ